MATNWSEMSEQSLKAAQILIREDLYRSAISRAYYAAYCCVTVKLTQTGASFARGWNNPSHDQVPSLVLNCSGIPRTLRWQVNRLIRVLRAAREDADYRPHVEVDRALAISCLHSAASIRTLLEKQDD